MMKTGKFIKTGARPRAITCANGDTIEAGAGQFFQESSHGQAWELWEEHPKPGLGMQFVARFPKKRVLWVHETKG